MFYVNNLDVRQSRQANDSASIVKHAIFPFDAIPPLMRASRKIYGSNSFFQSYIKIIVLGIQLVNNVALQNKIKNK